MKAGIVVWAASAGPRTAADELTDAQDDSTSGETLILSSHDGEKPNNAMSGPGNGARGSMTLRPVVPSDSGSPVPVWKAVCIVPV